MKMKNKQSFHLPNWICLIILSLGIIISCQKKEHPTFTTDEAAVAYAQKNLSSEGILNQKKDGFVYLKIDDEYVIRLLQFFQKEGYRLPNSFNRPQPIGAHISVMYENETNSIGTISALGRHFSFKPKKIKRVRVGRKEEIILQVDASTLAQLRESYGLPAKLHHHEFHITLGQKRLFKSKSHSKNLFSIDSK